MPSHKHRFLRLSDVAIYCECGEIRESPVRPAPVVVQPLAPANPLYVPPVVVPVHPPNQPFHPAPPERIRWSQ
jgi:hypothetical protein